MKTTHHASKRMQQRGFSEPIINIITNYGREEHLPGGAIGIFLGDKEFRKIIEELKKYQNLLEKARNTMIVIKDDHILTCYRSH